MLLKSIDEYIQKNNLDLPVEEVKIFDDGYRAPVIQSLNVVDEGISVIIWASGYSRDYSLVQLPIVDAYNFPITNRGVTNYPGLYFLGMIWMNTLKSGFLLEIGNSAQYLAEVICNEKQV
jgi:putative flavoprotein involved in K+ transport